MPPLLRISAMLFTTAMLLAVSLLLAGCAPEEKTMLLPQASSTATAFHTPLTPAITVPFSTPAIKSPSVQLRNAGLDAISSIALATSSPRMGPSVRFQVQ